jgi:predicted GTPase
MKAKKVLIFGAAGRDFHNFNVVFRGNADYSVGGFTATQIPGIANRRYAPELAGPLYPAGIPSSKRTISRRLVEEQRVDAVVFQC